MTFANPGFDAQDDRDFPPGYPVHAAVQRLLSNHFAFWCLCEASTCRRARSCKGDPARCLDACMPLLPEDAHRGGLRVFEGHAEELSFDEAFARWPDEMLAWTHWVNHLKKSRGRART